MVEHAQCQAVPASRAKDLVSGHLAIHCSWIKNKGINQTQSHLLPSESSGSVHQSEESSTASEVCGVSGAPQSKQPGLLDISSCSAKTTLGIVMSGALNMPQVNPGKRRSGSTRR
jgi:hypothetical protein